MFEKPIVWPRYYWKQQMHHARYKRRVMSMLRKLMCQDCGGAGGEKINIGLDDGTGPWEQCNWCEGTGLVTPHRRGEWLRYKAGLRA